jgi:hypothetical protein
MGEPDPAVGAQPKARPVRAAGGHGVPDGQQLGAIRRGGAGADRSYSGDAAHRGSLGIGLSSKDIL